MKNMKKNRLIKTDNNTKILVISKSLYRRFVDHSAVYYNVPATYEEILENLLKSYDENNKEKRYVWTD